MAGVGAGRASSPKSPTVLDGPVDGPCFVAYVEQVLAPTLHPGDCVVMDNLACHKVAGGQHAIEAVGARLLYLPPYSPDFNPIEQVFAKRKARCARHPAAHGRPLVGRRWPRPLGLLPCRVCQLLPPRWLSPRYTTMKTALA